MKIYRIDRTEVFPRLIEEKAVYAIEESSTQHHFTALREQTIREIIKYIGDEKCNFFVCE